MLALKRHKATIHATILILIIFFIYVIVVCSEDNGEKRLINGTLLNQFKLDNHYYILIEDDKGLRYLFYDKLNKSVFKSHPKLESGIRYSFIIRNNGCIYAKEVRDEE